MMQTAFEASDVVDALLSLAGSDVRADLRGRVPHPSASCDACGALQGVAYLDFGGGMRVRRFGWWPAPNTSALGLYGTLCDCCVDPGSEGWPQ